jgi:uncharacterized protein
LEEAGQIAKQFGFSFLKVVTTETSDQRYLENPKNRCYFCKQELYTRLQQIKKETKVEFILDGANVDDLGDYRPGRQAAGEALVRSPLIEAGLGKVRIRELAKAWGLPNWDKPAMPCLSSRVPYGERIDLEKLKRIELAEQFFRERGIGEVRVRHHDLVARIEVQPEDFQKMLRLSAESDVYLRSLGFHFTALDLRGLKSGSLNL